MIRLTLSFFREDRVSGIHDQRKFFFFEKIFYWLLIISIYGWRKTQIRADLIFFFNFYYVRNISTIKIFLYSKQLQERQLEIL